MSKASKVSKLKRRLVLIPTLLLLGLALLLVGPVESKKKPNVLLTAITQLKKSGIVKVWHKKALKGGKVRCDSKYRATRKLNKAFLHVYNMTCWSCPKGYKRSADPKVAGTKACLKPAYSKWSKAKYRGRGRKIGISVQCPRGAFRHGLTDKCYSCPRGYKRTVHSINSSKACEKVERASFKRASQRGKAGCNKGYFQHGMTDRCYKCPKGYNRTLVITKDPSKHRKACEKIKVNPPKAIKKQLNAFVDKFKKGILGKKGKDFGKIISSLKSLKTTPNFSKLSNKQRATEAKKIMNKYNMFRLLRSITKKKGKNVFSSALKADGDTCSSNSQCSSDLCNTVTNKCVSTDWQSFTLTLAGDIGYVASFEKAITVAFRHDENAGGKSAGVVYEESYLGVGATFGGDVSLDIGAFVDTNDNLAGELLGVTFAAAYKIGYSVSLWFTCPGKTACFFGDKNFFRLAGFQVAPSGGVGAELEFGIVSAKKLF